MGAVAMINLLQAGKGGGVYEAVFVFLGGKKAD